MAKQELEKKKKKPLVFTMRGNSHYIKPSREEITLFQFSNNMI